MEQKQPQTMISIDFLIEKLQSIRDEIGHDVPVIMYDGYNATKVLFPVLDAVIGNSDPQHGNEKQWIIGKFAMISNVEIKNDDVNIRRFN